MIQNLKLMIVANVSLKHPAEVHDSMQFGDLKSFNPMFLKVRTNCIYSCMLSPLITSLPVENVNR